MRAFPAIRLLLLAILAFAVGCKGGNGAARGPMDRLKSDRIGAAVVLARHPGLERALHAEFARPVGAMRIDWGDEAPKTGGPAEHEWDPRGGRIIVRASPEYTPEDQLLAVFLEIENARSFPRFLALQRDAVAGRIGRDDYPDELIRIEHGAFLAAKSLFPGLLPIPPEEIDRHRLSRDLLRAPDDFEAFLQWRKTEFAAGYARNREHSLSQYDELIAKGVDPSLNGRR